MHCQTSVSFSTVLALVFAQHRAPRVFKIEFLQDVSQIHNFLQVPWPRGFVVNNFIYSKIMRSQDPNELEFKIHAVVTRILIGSALKQQLEV